MNNKTLERLRLLRDPRAKSLIGNAQWYRDGIYMTAGWAAGSRSVAALLRDIANNGPQTAEENVFVMHLAAAVANGDDVAKALGIERPKKTGRQTDPLNRDLMQMVDRLAHAMIAEGMTVETAKTAAIKNTAVILREVRDPEKKKALPLWIDVVRKAYDKGKRVEKEVEKDVQRRMAAAEVEHERARKKGRAFFR